MRMSSWQRVKSVREIGTEMYRIANTHANDLGKLGVYSLEQIFDYVKAKPYFREPGNFQLLVRPKWVMVGLSPVVACANKAILLGSWAKLHRIPYRFVAVSPVRFRSLSHVFAEFYLNGKWVPMDATYNWGSIGHSVDYPHRKVLTPT